MNLPVEQYFERLIRLMELEAEAEKQAMLRDLQRRTPTEAEASGNSLVDLVLRETDIGLGGRILFTLGKRDLSQPLPWTRLGTGAPVVLSENDAAASGDAGMLGWRGIVSRVQPDAIQVAFPEWPEPQGERPTFRLDRASDEIARKRQRKAMDRAQAAGGNRLAALRDVLLGEQPPDFRKPERIEYFNDSLNEPQREAVQFALTGEDVAVIHGPPGTGKTTTVVELIRQLTHRGERVLACAPSNLAVDNILERLLAAGERVIRLGHPARVLPELREHTLDLLVENHPDVKLARKLEREAHTIREQAGKYRRARPEPGARQAMRQEAKEMIAEARQIESQVIDRLLDSAQVLCATNTGLDWDMLGRRRFDWCVMDEASQTTEPSAWIPLLRSSRLVLAGDPFQLPPTVLSKEAAAEGFNVSLLERLMAQLGPGIARRLTVQYRMHQDIMTFSSLEFYESSLVAAPSVQYHLLQDLPGVHSGELIGTPVHFIDTAGASFDEAVDPDGESRFNPMEAGLVLRKVQDLLDAGLSPSQIAVISPYSAQVRRLRELIRHPEIEVDTVDGFQGREKEAVVVSLVRSNLDGDIGFLADVRRMNVALTRARRKLIVIGDSATITNHPFYRRLVAYFDSVDAYQSVWEEA